MTNDNHPFQSIDEVTSNSMESSTIACEYSTTGDSLLAQSKINAAFASYQHALRHDAENLNALSGLGAVMLLAKRFDLALRAYQELERLRGGAFTEHANLANALLGCNQLPEAMRMAVLAVSKDQSSSHAQCTLGTVLYCFGEYTGALAAFAKAIELNPENANAHCNVAEIMLLHEDFERGWQRYQWRFGPPPQFSFARDTRRWDGTPLGPQSLLVYAEQGLGDTLQFVRYVHDVQVRAPRCSFAVQPRLVHLLRNSFPQADFFSASDVDHGAFDRTLPFLSLPYALGDRGEVSASTPYLQAEQRMVEAWKRRTADRMDLNVGLCWTGQPTQDRNLHRSIPLSLLDTLSIANVHWVCLQKDISEEDAAFFERRLCGSNLEAECSSIEDTAALIASLDLVVTVDTSIAHLAGGLGVPVWILLPYAPDWRWALGSERTRWYPRARLFRQQSPGSWVEVIRRVLECLDHEAECTQFPINSTRQIA